MTGSVKVALPGPVHVALVSHLLPPRPRAEEAAFVFARLTGEVFEYVDWYAVPPVEFEHRSLYAIELGDACRAKTIKHAHDLSCSILEFHSHPFPRVAQFSPSDCLGFAEYVPHVRWRLKGRPYAAFVVAPSSFDSLVWLASAEMPAGTAELQIGGKILTPTGLTFQNWEFDNAT